MPDHPEEHGGFLPGRSGDGSGIPRTDLYTGLPGGHITWLDEIMDNRLSSSSMRKVSRALDLWDEAREHLGWPQVIMTGDPERGAKMVVFARYLAENVDLTYQSICTYVWRLRQWCKLQHQADPCEGIINWLGFMKSLKVPTYAIGEPRRRVPKALLVKILNTTDHSDFSAVQLALILVVYFLCYPRAEQFPKNHTGEESFHVKKHWLVRDFTVRGFPFGYLFGVRFKATKPDPRIERDGAAGDGWQWGNADALGGYDFTWIGDVPGTPFSVLTWFRRFLSFFSGPRHPASYMFLDPDRVRALTYRVLSSQFQAALVRVGYVGPPLGMHGIRVEGYNESKAANGEDLTAIHGLWLGPKATGHGRYARFSMLDVANISARMVGEDDVYAPTVSARQIRRTNIQSAPAFQPEEGGNPAGGTEPEGEAEDSAPAEDGASSSAATPSGSANQPPLVVGAPVQAVVVDITGEDSVPDDISEDSGDGLYPPWRAQLVSPPLPATRRPPPTTRARAAGPSRITTVWPSQPPTPPRGGRRGRGGRGGRGRGRDVGYGSDA